VVSDQGAKEGVALCELMERLATQEQKIERETKCSIIWFDGQVESVVEVADRVENVRSETKEAEKRKERQECGSDARVMTNRKTGSKVTREGEGKCWVKAIKAS
jgi:hypothetical protein